MREVDLGKVIGDSGLPEGGAPGEVITYNEDGEAVWGKLYETISNEVISQSFEQESPEGHDLLDTQGLNKLQELIRSWVQSEYAKASHNHDAGNITSGTLADARIPNLGAGKITSGTLGVDRIPGHSTDKLTSGTLGVARGGTGQTSLQATRNAMGLGNTTGVLPIANGGTGTSSSDPVVASGTSGNWNYVKFNNGIAICWYVSNQHTAGAPSSWGSLMYGDCGTSAYPFSFTSKPFVVDSIESDSGTFWVTTKLDGTASVSPGYYNVTASKLSGTKNVKRNILAMGRWK